MRLSKLIELAEKAKNGYGDIEVFSSVNYDKMCSECGGTTSHLKTGKAEGTFINGLGINTYQFYIECVEI